ncbi:MAG: HlyC/CorC family transporter [Acidobacteria bacterium]|nr:MAG: HlyC/CorC family transporter [Acidobacteriota bacterium]
MLIAIVLGLVVILSLSAFFSGSETALMSLDRFRLRHLEKTEPRAARVTEVVAHPEKVLGTILTGNVFVNTAAGALVTYAITVLVASADRRGQAITIATIVLTGLILVFGEMVPKSLAARHPEAWALLVIRPLSGLICLLSPAVKVLTMISNGLLSLFGVSTGALSSTVTLEEIKALLYGSVPEDERGPRRQMLRKVIELAEKRVAAVMIPRTEMVAVEKDTPLEEIVRIIQNQRFSRMPVFDETLDNIIGLLFAKDVLTYWGARVPFQLGQVLRRPYFIPDSARVEQALEQLQQQHTHMALVVDEHGGVEGLVTLEDLLEEIVGELFDEKDVEESQIFELPDGSYLLDGVLSITDANEQLSLELPEHADYHTLAGLILDRLGHIPVAGEELDTGGTILSVDKVVSHRILRVRAKRTASKRA